MIILIENKNNAGDIAKIDEYEYDKNFEYQ